MENKPKGSDEPVYKIELVCKTGEMILLNIRDKIYCILDNAIDKKKYYDVFEAPIVNIKNKKLSDFKYNYKNLDVVNRDLINYILGNKKDKSITELKVRQFSELIELIYDYKDLLDLLGGKYGKHNKEKHDNYKGMAQETKELIHPLVKIFRSDRFNPELNLKLLLKKIEEVEKREELKKQQSSKSN